MSKITFSIDNLKQNINDILKSLEHKKEQPQPVISAKILTELSPVLSKMGKEIIPIITKYAPEIITILQNNTKLG